MTVKPLPSRDEEQIVQRWIHKTVSGALDVWDEVPADIAAEVMAETLAILNNELAGFRENS